jgi:small subunit ribosomal protein S4
LTRSLYNITPAAFEKPNAERLQLPQLGLRPRVLLLYGSLRQRSYSRFLTLEAARLLEAFGADTRIFDPSGLPLPDDAPEGHLKVEELRGLSAWSEVQVWCSPERYGAMTGIIKAQLRLDSALDRRGAADQGQDARGDGSQSFNAVNQLRILGRWMRMITIPNQSSVAKAHEQFDEAGRIRPSPNYDRLVNVMVMKFKYLTRGASDYLTSRFSERKEKGDAEKLSASCRPYDCDAILTRAAKRPNSTASRCAVWSFETRRAGPAKDAPGAAFTHISTYVKRWACRLGLLWGLAEEGAFLPLAGGRTRFQAPRCRAGTRVLFRRNALKGHAMTKRAEAKYKIDRRMGQNIWGRPKSPFNRREYGPGQHGQRRKGKLSDFGTQLRAKQKLKGYYGNISEKQFRKYYAEAIRMKGDSGDNLIGLLERRLDAVIYRAKFVPTIFAARQFVNHGHVKVNGRRVDIASHQVKVGDRIELKESSRQIVLVLEAQQLAERDVPDYYEVDHTKMTAKITRIPLPSEVPYPVMMEPNLVIEFYSR